MAVHRPSTIQSIERAAALMRCFTEAEPEMGVTELSHRLGLHKSTVMRILSTLQQEGFVGRNPTTGKYRLGVGLISLAGVALGRVDVRAAAYPHLEELVTHTRESANVLVRDGAEAIIVLNNPSPNPVRYVNWIGRRLPLFCTASGKVLLAGLPVEERLKLLPQPLRRYTEKTITTTRQLEEELACVSSQGFALAIEEFEPGYSAIAAPLHRHDGRVAGAVSVSGPSFRLPAEALGGFAGPLRATADRISAEMGYAGHSFDGGY
jgi:DNA-binding IclR family transcriptional regulator